MLNENGYLDFYKKLQNHENHSLNKNITIQKQFLVVIVIVFDRRHFENKTKNR